MTKAKGAAPAAFPNTNLHAIFKTNTSLEEDGAWVSVNDIYGLDIKVRRMRSDAAVKAYERIIKDLFGDGKLRRPDDLTPEQSMSILKRQLAEAVLVDWRNLRDTETGDEIPYSKEMALHLMEMKDFREFVYQAANERDTFREKMNKDAEGNS